MNTKKLLIIPLVATLLVQSYRTIYAPRAYQDIDSNGTGLILKSQKAGFIKKLIVHQGNRVHQGDLLAQIGGNHAELDLHIAQARLNKAQAHYDYEKGSYEKQKQLFKAEGISQDPKTGEFFLSHRVSPSGFYRGELIHPPKAPKKHNAHNFQKRIAMRFLPFLPRRSYSILINDNAFG